MRHRRAGGKLRPCTAAIWLALKEMFASQTRAHAVNIRIALATTKKGSLTVAEYIAKMRGLADEMAAAGKPQN